MSPNVTCVRYGEFDSYVVETSGVSILLIF